MSRNYRACRPAGFARRLRVEPLEHRQLLATLTVNSTADTHINSDGVLTLREAIEVVAQGNTNGLDSTTIAGQISGPLGSNDSIKFAGGLNGAQITLVLAFGQLDISKSLVIDASTLSSGITINANDPTPGERTGTGIRIFNITDPSGGVFPPIVELAKLTLRGGDVLQQGGAIRSEGVLIIRHCTIEQNAADFGGAIYLQVAGGSPTTQREILTIEDTVIQDNEALTGGGIYVVSGTSVSPTADVISIMRTTIADNDALSPFNVGGGGGLFAQLFGARLTVTASTIFGNTTAVNSGFYLSGGAGIHAELRTSASLNIDSTLVSGNTATAGNGGGILAKAYEDLSNPYPAQRAITITRSTISDNRAGDRGGGLFTFNREGTEVLVEDSRVTGNHGPSFETGYHRNGGGIYAYLWNGYDMRPYVDAALKPKWTITGSTIDDNDTFNEGGGIFVCSKYNGDFIATNCTISGNRTTDQNNGAGGGMFIAHYPSLNESVDAWLSNLTITQNSSAMGGGVGTLDFSDVRVRIKNSIISQNFSDAAKTTPNNLDGRLDIASTNYNLVGSGSTILDLSGGSELLNTTNLNYTNLALNNTPGLGPLAENGGPTQTHNPLSSSSPVVNAGDPNAVPGVNGVPDTDQRGDGYPRRIYSRIDIGAVEYFPTGDYNRDGTANAADYTVWRNALGTMVVNKFDGADGDGDGVIGANDYLVWKNNYGNTTGLVMADFSRNGAADIADYILWASTFGSTTDLRADCNEDGIVDDADFDIWFDTFGSTLGIGQFGLLSSMFDPDAPPAVVGFALSFPGDATVDFAGKVGSGEQIRSAPLIAANNLSITFSQDVNITQNALQVINLDGNSPNVLSFAYDAASQTATWTFTAALANGRYLVRLSDAVQNWDGKALDGEFFNPWTLSATGTSVFPSGDGDAGGEFRFRFTVLAGDSDHNNIDGATNYTTWQSTEPGMIIVSTTADDYDGNLSFGDVSLREAVNYANNASGATAIQLPSGRYVLTRVGTEGSDTAYNDLDVLSTTTVLGAGAGLSIIDNSGLTAAMTRRAFDLTTGASHLTLDGVTIAHGTAAIEDGLAVRVSPGGSLVVTDSALVHHVSMGGGSAIFVDRGSLTIRRSVVTNDWDQVSGGAAVYVKALSGSASVLVEDSVFALNHQHEYTGDTTKNVQTVGYVTKTNEGGNLYDDATGGFFDTTPGEGDHLGSVNYVVTSVADTFNHADDNEALSIREAVDLANQAAGAQEIWLPAWHYVLTLGRGSHATDTDVAYGDIDVKDSAIVRGVADRTNVAWKAGIVDKVFELLADSDGDGIVSSADYAIWQNQNGSSGGLEQFSADADDDGDVDAADYNLWNANYGHSLLLFDVGV